MNVVILHCHFQRGGVTQVVENHVEALSGQVDSIVLVSGGRLDGLSETTLERTTQVNVEGLEYDALAAVLGHRGDARSIAADLASRLSELGCEPNNTVLHWHNHSLGKNVASPVVIVLNAEFGFRQLLQIHDFAEDYRPENYRRLIESCRADQAVDFIRFCYPIHPRIHYATLTRADASAIRSIGVPPAQVHTLPNCVTLPGAEIPDKEVALEKIHQAAGLPADSRWCVYPVRGIRRKNVGEFCLLSRLLPEGMFAGITLPPATEIERESYERWKGLAAELAPRAVFDAGTFENVNFFDNLAASDFIVSTSVAEGFGMAFLEPWLAGRGVVARRLPTVVADFEQFGLRLDRFYESLLIPCERTWLDQVREETEAAFAAAWRDLPERFRPRLPETTTNDGAIDFARLTPPRQIEVLNRVASDPGFEHAVRAQNPTLVSSLTSPFLEQTIDENARVVRKSYSLERAARDLKSIYASLWDATDQGDSTSVGANTTSVDLVCSPRDFFPCRTEATIAR